MRGPASELEVELKVINGRPREKEYVLEPVLPLPRKSSARVWTSTRKEDILSPGLIVEVRQLTSLL